jgi:serine/threonine-protein kinase RsbT
MTTLRQQIVVGCFDVRDRFYAIAVALRVALAIGFTRQAAAEIATAAGELASNLVRHGGGGTLGVRWIRDALVGDSIELVTEDEGPGIDDVAAALRDGWSDGRPRGPDEHADGLGTGLGAVQRAMDTLTISARSVRGAEVRASRRLKRDAQ